MKKFVFFFSGKPMFIISIWIWQPSEEAIRKSELSK